jgi:PKD repeat protein
MNRSTSLRYTNFPFLPVLLLALVISTSWAAYGAPPTVHAVAPANLAIDVSPTIKVAVTFSEPMDQAATEGAFSLTNGTTPVNGTFSWSGYTMTYTPASALAYNATYWVVVSMAAKDVSDNYMVSQFISSFTTGAPPAATPSITNIIDHLATSDLSGWTANGAGVQTGTTISAGGSQCYYTRGDLDISNRQAWLIEAVLSAPAVGIAGERGARLWAKFFDPDAPFIPPPPYRRLRTIEIRLAEDAGGNKRLALVDGADGSEKAALSLDWTTTGPSYRVRMKRQRVSGVDYIFLQAEPANTFDDPADPNPVPDTVASVKVALSAFSATTGTLSEFGFGNVVPGTYYSDWESIHVTRSDDDTTILPYWPPAPPDPVLIFDDRGAGNLQGIDFSAYSPGRPYLQNDTVTPYLEANGTIFIGEQRTYPGDEYWDFDGLLDEQTVTGSIVVSDVSGRSRVSGNVSLSFPKRVTGNGVNSPPALTPIGNKTVNEGELLQFTVTATDPDGDAVTYSASNLPSDAIFDSLTGNFSWIPDYTQAGNYSVTFTATDNGIPQMSASETITITVGITNQPPVFTPIGNKTVNEGEFLHFTITATDPDGDAVRYSTSNLPPGATFDSTTRTFYWMPDFTQAGNYKIVFTATDNGTPRLSSSELIEITVVHVNRPPTLNPIGNKSVNEGQLLKITITATDPDGTAISYFASNLPPGALFDAATQTFTWKPTYDQAGYYVGVLFTATDNGIPPASALEAITITVVNVNRPPVLALIGDGATPIVRLVGPANLAADVSPTIKIAVTFSEPMDQATTEGAFSLTNGTAPVDGTFSWSGYTMTYTPNSTLAYNTTYQIMVSKAAKNVSGANMASNFTSSFTTGAPPVVAPSLTNIFDDLTTSTLSDWAAFGSGGRLGMTFTGPRYYTRGDLDISNRQAWLIEAVLSAPPVGSAGERGARLWARFLDPDAPNVPPFFYKLRFIELSLQEDSGGNRRLAIADGNDGLEKASLNLDWSTTGPRYRVRLKRQRVSGVDYIFLQAEPANTFDDAADPNPVPDTAASVKVALSAFSATTGNLSEFGFGNAATGGYTSDWESVHVTRCDDDTTILPYWPPAPPEPVLVFDDRGYGNPQGIDFSAYSSGRPYLENDSFTPYLDANGTTFVGEPAAHPSDNFWYFDGLFNEQTVTGHVLVSDVSGRSRVSSNVSVTLPAPIGNKTVNEGELLRFTLTAMDPDGDAVTYSVSHLPSGAIFDSSTGTFSWIPDYTQAGEYSLVFTATDNGTPPLSISETVNIVVKQTNRPPVASPTAIPNSGRVPLKVQFAANASDPDGDPLTYSWAFGDGVTSTDTNPTHIFNAPGTYIAWLTVSDGKVSTSSSLSIAVSSSITLSTRLASVLWVKKPVTGIVMVWADFTAPMPAPNDLVMVTLDGIQLIAQPFSAFRLEPKTGNYVLSKSGVLAWLNFHDGRFFVLTPTITLSGLNINNGVDVELWFGGNIAVQNITMTPLGKILLVYRRPDVTGNP